MRRSAEVSPRAFLIAGLSAAVVGAPAVTPGTPPAPNPPTIATAVQLASLASGLEAVMDNLQGVAAGIGGAVNNLTNGIEGAFTNVTDGIETAITNLTNGVGLAIANLTTNVELAIANFTGGLQGVFDNLTGAIDQLNSLTDGPQAAIKRAYDKAEQWSAYAADWAHFSLGLLPGLWWVAPSVPFSYNTAEPLIRAGVYSFADLVGLDLVQFSRDIAEGLATAASNAATYGKAWTDSFVAVPELPPYPGPPPGLLLDGSNATLPAASTATPAAPEAAAVTGGIEETIQDTDDDGNALATAREDTGPTAENAKAENGDPAGEDLDPAIQTAAPELDAAEGEAQKLDVPKDEAPETGAPADTTAKAATEAAAPARAPRGRHRAPTAGSQTPKTTGAKAERPGRSSR